MSAHQALERLERIPRLELGRHPTPLLDAGNLRAEIGPGCPRILLKMDAWNGFGLGANKVRKLEMILSESNRGDADCLITCGGVQSNHARVTAAAAARLGLRCILVLDGEEPERPRGNALLHRLLGAEIRTVPDRGARDEALADAGRDVEAAGGRPLVIPLGASTPLGALGYARGAVELDGQLQERGAWDREGSIHLVVASSSCGTLGGLLLGFSLTGRRNLHLRGVSADVPETEILERSRELATQGARLLDRELDPASTPVLHASDDWVGPGYGVPTPESEAATRLFARREGVILDPVYTAKAAAALLALCRGGDTEEKDTVVFLHTGGHPALLA